MSDSPAPQKDGNPIRVLFIVDSLYWVIGNFAKQIKDTSSNIQATICSKFAIRKAIERFGNLSSPFDVIHHVYNKSFNPFEKELPTVTTFHHLDSKTNIHQFRESPAVMTVSQEWRDYLIEKGIPPEDIFLVPFGVNTDAFRQSKEGESSRIRKTLKIPTNAFVVGISGKPTSNRDGRKGLDCFSRGIHQLHSQHPNIATLLIGPGWHHFAKELRKDGIPCTHLSYEQDHNGIAEFYRAMDIFWVTSRIEGGPVPLLEAMASGLPCISTPVGAALDLIENERNGFIAPFNKAEEFVKISLQVLNDHELKKRIGEEARQTILAERQWKHAEEKIVDLYRFAIKNFQSIKGKEESPLREKTTFNFEKTNQPAGPLKTWEFSSSQVQNWMKACEEINGLKMMVEMKEWKAASRFGLRAFCTSPFSPYLWKEIISALKKGRKSKHPQPTFDKPKILLAPQQPL